jgi:hypothetical protein
MAPPFRSGGRGAYGLAHAAQRIELRTAEVEPTLCSSAPPGIDPAFRAAGSPAPTPATAPGSGRVVTGPNTDELQERIPAPHGLGGLAASTELGEVVDAASRLSAQADSFAGRQVSGVVGDRPAGPRGQAVAGGLLVWRGRRVCGAPAAAVVDPGFRPRFFSVLPTPASFRSR